MGQAPRSLAAAGPARRSRRSWAASARPVQRLGPGPESPAHGQRFPRHRLGFERRPEGAQHRDRQADRYRITSACSTPGTPSASETPGMILNHDNLAITDFRAESRSPPRACRSSFPSRSQLRLQGREELPQRLHRRQQDRDFTASVPLENLPANSEVRAEDSRSSSRRRRQGRNIVLVSAQAQSGRVGLAARQRPRPGGRCAQEDPCPDRRRRAAGKVRNRAATASTSRSACSAAELTRRNSRRCEELAGLNLDDLPQHLVPQCARDPEQGGRGQAAKIRQPTVAALPRSSATRCPASFTTRSCTRTQGPVPRSSWPHAAPRR